MLSFLRSWRQDRVLRGVVRSSSYLFSSNTIMAALSMLQGILVVRLVGMEGLGLVTTITVFISNVHRLMSFRMNEVVVQNLGEAIEQKNAARASTIVRWAMTVEAVAGILAFLVLIVFAPWAARLLAKDLNVTDLFRFYGLVLLGNLLFETSTGILQTLRAFAALAKINILQSLLTAAVILAAFLTHQGVGMVLAGYLIGKAFAGLAVTACALWHLRHNLGVGWWKQERVNAVDSLKLFRFALNTNLQGTVNLFVRDNIPLLLAALRSQAEVGYFKLALSIINLVMLPIEPLIWPTYAEITRAIAGHQYELTRRLLQRVSLIAAAWTVSAGGAVAVLGPWLIPWIYGVEASPAYPAFLLLLLGYGFANILNWNRPLLLALGNPGFPLAVAIIVGVVEIGLSIWLVPSLGYLSQALILSGYFIVSIGIVTWRGLRELQWRALKEIRFPQVGVQP
jgi:O-antigen/teichoic acid export membrane protein